MNVNRKMVKDSLRNSFVTMLRSYGTNRAWFRFFGLLISATAGTLYDLRKSHSNLEIQIMVQTSGIMLSLLQEFPCCSICSKNCYFT